MDVRAPRRTARLRLRPITHADHDEFLAIHLDPRTNSNRPDGPPSREWTESFLLSLIEAWQADLTYWAVESEGRVVGFAGAERMTIFERECWNLYYRFSPEVWGRGFATEAAREAVAVAAALDSGRPVVARTMPSNTAAIRVAERAGLTCRSDLDHGGYAVLAANW